MLTYPQWTHTLKWWQIFLSIWRWYTRITILIAGQTSCRITSHIIFNDMPRNTFTSTNNCGRQTTTADDYRPNSTGRHRVAPKCIATCRLSGSAKWRHCSCWLTENHSYTLLLQLLSWWKRLVSRISHILYGRTRSGQAPFLSQDMCLNLNNKM